MVVFLFSCEKEDDQEVSVQENDSALKSFHTSVYQLESNAKFSKALKGILGESSLQGRGNGEGSFGIEVDSSYVKIIKGKGFDTYTMQIKNKSQSNLSFSNLVVKLYQDSENDEAYVFDYLSDEPMSYYEPHQSYTFSGATLVSYVNTGYPNQTLSQDCFIMSITVCWHARVGNGTGPLHIAGSKCQTSEHMMTFATENCIGLPEYNPGNEPPNDYVNPCLREDCGGGGSIPQEEIDIPTEPVLVTAHNYFRNPSQELNDLWIFVLDNTIKNDIIDFLNDNKEPGQVDATPEAEAFAEEAIKALKDNDGDGEPDGDVDYEDRVILDLSTPDCLNDIIDTLKNCSSEISLLPELSANINLTSLVLNTFDNISNHGLKIQTGNLPSNKNATTTPSSLGNNTFMYIITINNSYLQNATDLAIARTIIHEALHAYLSYIYQDQPFSDLSNILRHHLTQNGYDNNVAQHQVMVDFVSAMAYALQSWDNNNLGGLNYYNYLAWSGDLLNTPEFNTQTSIFQNNVVNANLAEGQANSAATSSAQGTDNCN